MCAIAAETVTGVLDSPTAAASRAKMGTKMVSFGEAMIRFLPKETELPTPLPPSAAQDFLR